MARPQPSDVQIAKVLSHPVRPRILEIVTDRGEASPNQIASAIGSSLGSISYHVRVLRDEGWLELARTEPRRGAVEHFYRPGQPPFLDDARWESLPLTIRRGLAGQTVGEILRAVSSAVSSGGFDRPEVHVDRMPLNLDDQGWRELSEVLTAVLAEARRIEARSQARMRTPTKARSPSQLAILHYATEPSQG